MVKHQWACPFLRTATSLLYTRSRSMVSSAQCWRRTEWWKEKIFLSCDFLRMSFMRPSSLWCPHSSSTIFTQSIIWSPFTPRARGSHRNLYTQRKMRKVRVSAKQASTITTDATPKGFPVICILRQVNRSMWQQSMEVVMMSSMGTRVSSMSFASQKVRVCWAVLLRLKLEMMEMQETSSRMMLLNLLPMFGSASNKNSVTTERIQMGTSCCQTKPTLIELIVKRKPMCWQGFNYYYSSSNSNYRDYSFSPARHSFSLLLSACLSPCILTMASMSEDLRFCDYRRWCLCLLYSAMSLYIFLMTCGTSRCLWMCCWSTSATAWEEKWSILKLPNLPLPENGKNWAYLVWFCSTSIIMLYLTAYSVHEPSPCHCLNSCCRIVRWLVTSMRRQGKNIESNSAVHQMAPLMRQFTQSGSCAGTRLIRNGEFQRVICSGMNSTWLQPNYRIRCSLRNYLSSALSTFKETVTISTNLAVTVLRSQSMFTTYSRKALGYTGTQQVFLCLLQVKGVLYSLVSSKKVSLDLPSSSSFISIQICYLYINL